MVVRMEEVEAQKLEQLKRRETFRTSLKYGNLIGHTPSPGRKADCSNRQLYNAIVLCSKSTKDHGN